MYFAAISVMGGIAPCKITGSLDATAVAGTATSAAVTINVPGGNSGQIRINFSDIGTVLFAQFKQNAAAFSAFSDGDIIGFANNDALILRTTGDNPGESRTYTLTDVTTGKVIATVFHAGG